MKPCAVSSLGSRYSRSAGTLPGLCPRLSPARASRVNGGGYGRRALILFSSISQTQAITSGCMRNSGVGMHAPRGSGHQFRSHVDVKMLQKLLAPLGHVHCIIYFVGQVVPVHVRHHVATSRIRVQFAAGTRRALVHGQAWSCCCLLLALTGGRG